MSKIQELSTAITHGQSKLAEHQREVTYWLTKELPRLNQELIKETKWVNDEAAARNAKKS